MWRRNLDENKSEENDLPLGHEQYDEESSVNKKKITEGKIALIFQKYFKFLLSMLISIEDVVNAKFVEIV